VIDIEKKELREINVWKNCDKNNPMRELDILIDKFSTAKHFIRKINKYRDIFESSASILEIGGGTAWASCIVKKLLPKKTVISSDLSKYAIEYHKEWERILNVSLDNTLTCKSYEIYLEDNSIDLIFAFQAAHHFVCHKKTLNEIYRVLKPGGICLYLNEPSCRQFIYKQALYRVNKKRPGLDIEDILIYKNIIKLAKDAGFDVNIKFDNSYINREFLEQNYYFLLSKFPFLNHILPSAVDYIFKK